MGKRAMNNWNGSDDLIMSYNRVSVNFKNVYECWMNGECCFGEHRRVNVMHVRKSKPGVVYVLRIVLGQIFEFTFWSTITAGVIVDIWYMMCLIWILLKWHLENSGRIILGTRYHHRFPVTLVEEAGRYKHLRWCNVRCSNVLLKKILSEKDIGDRKVTANSTKNISNYWCDYLKCAPWKCISCCS